MQPLKTITPKKLLWIDLEMTGLEATRDRILEVAVIVTDWNFKELASFESGVGQKIEDIQPRLDTNELFNANPATKEALLTLSQKSPSEQEVEAKVADLVRAQFGDEPALLAGNSIHTDRAFIRRFWPNLEALLHYRMLDVTAWKVVMLGKYGVEFPKREAHRALGDIRESIAELQFYLERVKT